MSADEVQIDKLLDHWEEVYERGRDMPIDELCSEYPELAKLVEAKIAQLRRLNKVLAPHDAPTEYQSGGLQPPVETVDVAARFVLSEFIDGGGLGSVFAGRDELLQREAAIKFLQQAHARLDERVKQFETECEITSRLDHPGVVPIYGHGTLTNGQPFYVMRRISGQTLRECADKLHNKLTSKAPTSEERVEFHSLLSTFISVCQTIHYAHCRGVIHRDIKPTNIMVGKHGETLVLDWGLATPIGRDEYHQNVAEVTLQVRLDSQVSDWHAGTPIYMSPEQHAGTDVGSLSDVYSLGATLYVLLTGKPPFSGQTLSALRAKVLRGEKQNPKSIYRWLSNDLAAICAKAMSVDPAERYVTALDLARDVERYLADEPVQAYQESLLRRCGRWMSRRRLLTFLIATALIGGSIGSAVYSSIVTAFAHSERTARIEANTARHQSLRLAAGFAANSVALQLNDRWRILEIATREKELIRLLGETNGNPQNTDWTALQGLLLRNKEEYNVAAGQPASWFLCDATGRQVARVPASAASIGKNYAHRDYFHGNGLDVIPMDSESKHITNVHRSKVYVSTTTNTLRVALTRAVWSDSVVTPDRKFLGILGMSVSLGEFKELQAGLDSEQLVLVVDLEENVFGGESFEGLIMHHPKMQEQTEQQRRAVMGHSLLAETRLIRASALKHLNDNPGEASAWTAEMLTEFSDPWESTPVTNSHWIAAFAPVMVNGRPAEIADTGWGVIVAERETDRPGVFGLGLNALSERGSGQEISSHERRQQRSSREHVARDPDHWHRVGLGRGGFPGDRHRYSQR